MAKRQNGKMAITAGSRLAHDQKVIFNFKFLIFNFFFPCPP